LDGGSGGGAKGKRGCSPKLSWGRKIADGGIIRKRGKTRTAERSKTTDTPWYLQKAGLLKAEIGVKERGEMTGRGKIGGVANILKEKQGCKKEENQTQKGRGGTEKTRREEREKKGKNPARAFRHRVAKKTLHTP